MSIEQESMRENRINELQEILGRTAKDLDFEVLPSIEKRFEKYYTECNNIGDRCVDGRDKVDFSRGNYPYDRLDNTALGRQSPGGTLGYMRVLRLLTDESEAEAQGILDSVYGSSNWVKGDHIDNEHGKITDVKILKDRTKGCGNQDVLAEGKLSVYASLKLTRKDIDAGFEWIKDGGILAVLDGNHEELGAAVNLVPDSTFGTREAVRGASESLFNLDLWAVDEVARAVWSYLNEEEEVMLTEQGQDFCNKFAELVVTDYLQTLSALDGPQQIQTRKE